MKMVLSDASRKMNNKKHEQQQGYGSSSENNILTIMDDTIDDDEDDEDKVNHTPNCLAPFQQQQQRDVAVTFYDPFVPLMKLSLSLIVFVTIGVVIMTTMSLHNISPPPVSTTRQQQETLLSLAGINTRNGIESTHSTAGLRDDDDDDDDSNYSFQEFCLKYNKNYSNDELEYDRRKKIFTANVHKIIHHNQKKSSSFQLGINQFTDLTADELPLGLDKSASMRSSIPGIRSFSYELFPSSMEIENESETDTLLPYNRKLQQLKKKKKKHGTTDGDEKDDSDNNSSDEDADTNADTEDNAAAIKLIASLPDSVDWRTVILPDSKSRVTTPIKNQGHCGSCWAFASIAALESHIALTTGFLFTFSVQELISCAPNQDHCGSVAGGYGGGCNGSTGELAYDFISSGRGIVTEWDWGYISYAGSRGTCLLQPSPFSTDEHDDNDDDTSTTSTTKSSVKKHRKLDSSSDSSSDSDSSDSSSSDSSSSSSDSTSSDSLLDLFSDVFSSVQDEEEKETVDLSIPGAVASITGHTQLRTNSYIELLHAVATKGPVVVNVAASEGWLSYQGGIFTDLHEETRDVNHVVVVEGYGTDPVTHQDFWLVRNSWGPLWGEQGYIRLHRVNPYNPRACTANAKAAATAMAMTMTGKKGNKKLLDPCGECKMDLTPQDGIACVGPDFSITPKPVMVCGTSGILYDAVLPVGGALL